MLVNGAEIFGLFSAAGCARRVMSASDDYSLESEVRTRELAPRSGRSYNPYIVAATDRLQAFRFPQSSRQGVVEFALVCSDRACQGKQVQAFRCYEHNPPTFRRL